MFLSLKSQPSSPTLVDSLKRLPDQIAAALLCARGLKLPFNSSDINCVVVNGMGGSNLGAEIMRSVFRESLKLPLLIEPGYSVPAYVNTKTLYIITSYSGNTEEPLASYAAVKRRGAHILIIAGDGDNKLANLARKNNLPVLLFPTTTNPSAQPRLGLGLAIGSLVAALKVLKVLNISDAELTTVIKQLKKKTSALAAAHSPAKIMAKKLVGKEAILFGGQLFEGNLRTLRNQYCETAKNYASWLVVPDMNHYALEGLVKPSGIGKRLIGLAFASCLYSPQIEKRLKLTEQSMKRHGLTVLTYTLSGKTALEQSFDMLQFGSWLTYYLSLENRVDPLAIPSVDWFKEQL